MDIKCPECSTAYRIDDSKLPPSGQVIVKCAECGHKIKVSAPDGPRGNEKIETKAKGVEQESSAEYFDPDTKTAMVYCPEIQMKMEIEKKLTGLEFQVRSIADRSQAAHLLRFNLFDVIFLYQSRPEPEEKLLELLDYFSVMPPESRRRMLIAYMHIGGNRHDKLDAFFRGVDVCLNPMDVGRLGVLLPQLIQEKNAQYRVFHEVKRRVQEAVI